MSYTLTYTDDAKTDIEKLKKAGDTSSLKKLKVLLLELQKHPETGTGHPKPLGENRAVQWSRHISKKHCLVYEIQTEIVTILVLSAYGHYDDK